MFILLIVTVAASRDGPCKLIPDTFTPNFDFTKDTVRGSFYSFGIATSSKECYPLYVGKTISDDRYGSLYSRGSKFNTELVPKLRGVFKATQDYFRSSYNVDCLTKKCIFYPQEPDSSTAYYFKRSDKGWVVEDHSGGKIDIGFNNPILAIPDNVLHTLLYTPVDGKSGDMTDLLCGKQIPTSYSAAVEDIVLSIYDILANTDSTCKRGAAEPDTGDFFEFVKRLSDGLTALLKTKVASLTTEDT